MRQAPCVKINVPCHLRGHHRTHHPKSTYRCLPFPLDNTSCRVLLSWVIHKHIISQDWDRSPGTISRTSNSRTQWTGSRRLMSQPAGGRPTLGGRTAVGEGQPPNPRATPDDFPPTRHSWVPLLKPCFGSDSSAQKQDRSLISLIWDVRGWPRVFEIKVSVYAGILRLSLKVIRTVPSWVHCSVPFIDAGVGLL